MGFIAPPLRKFLPNNLHCKERLKTLVSEVWMTAKEEPFEEAVAQEASHLQDRGWATFL